MWRHPRPKSQLHLRSGSQTPTNTKRRIVRSLIEGKHGEPSSGLMSSPETHHLPAYTMNRPASPSPGTPAPYGRACVECSQSKCKCILRRVGGRCERCHRLDKDCRPSATVRRRNPRKSGASKSARLEEKIDGLLSLLKPGIPNDGLGAAELVASSNAVSATTAPYDSAYHSNVQTSTETSPSAHTEVGSAEAGSAARSVHNHVRESSEAAQATSSTVTAASSQTPISHDTMEPSLAEAEMCLTAFRVYKAKYFPFVYVPPTMTAQQLRCERPFLWLSIMTISSNSIARQQELGGKLRDILAQELLHTSGQNIDLLLGLLAYIGW